MCRWMHKLVAVMVGVGWLLAATPAGHAGDEQGAPRIVEVITDPATGRPRYEPGLLVIEPGDTVLFKNAGEFHASRIIPGMQPDGGQPWWGQLGEDVEITFTTPGLYGHKCGSSYTLGLVGLVVVGDATVNLESARAVQHPPAAARVFDKLFAELDRYLAK